MKAPTPLPHPARVAVIVPAYNAAATLEACLQSILAQQFANLQVIAVDDGSTDGSAAIADRLAAADPRLSVVHQPNRGRSAARAEGVSRATAEWVTFVDADDTLPPTALTLLLAAASAEVDIVLGNGFSLRGERRGIIPMTDFRPLAVRGEGTIGVPWGSLYRRTLATPERITLPRDFCMGEDYIFWLRVVFATERPVAIVYENVYTKGADTTSSSFRWTSAYAQRIQAYRLAAIPPALREACLRDTVSDRLTNLMAVSLHEPRRVWRRSPFFADLSADLRRLGLRLSLRQRLFLSLPLSLRRLYAALSRRRHGMGD